MMDVPFLPLNMLQMFRLSCLVTTLLISTLAPASADSALGGVDVVSLRDSGRVVGGDQAISTEWKGRAWVFTNEANRAAFEANPRAYAPAFSGNCPVSLAEGQPRKGSPKFPVVIGGTLYLTAGAGAQQQLQAGPEAILSAARQNWSHLGLK